tara:strand:+ start:57 stop:392 length:336 start_codon:yes stop_codon:yes gene_type:complete
MELGFGYHILLMSDQIQRGVAETVDVLVAARAALGALDAIMEDGKVNFADLPIVMGLMRPVEAAVDGFQSVAAELADFEPAEAQLIAEQVVPLVHEVIALVRQVRGPKTES